MLKRLKNLFGKIALMVPLLLLAGKASASDTLTRAQVYNFSVGDTFDYRTYYYHDQISYPQFSVLTISYQRYVIERVYWSLDSLTKYIVRRECYPTVSTDSLVLSQLSEYEAVLDTGGFSPCGIAILADSITFFGQPTNDLVIRPNGCDWDAYQEIFAKNLGSVLSFSEATCGTQACENIDSTLLIYYSGALGIFGTPYTLFPAVTGLNDPNVSGGKLQVLPSTGNGAFVLEIQDGNLLPLNLSVYDLMGREIKQLSLNQLHNDIYLQSLSKGLYIWKAAWGATFPQSGKLMID